MQGKALTPPELHLSTSAQWTMKTWNKRASLWSDLKGDTGSIALGGPAGEMHVM